MDGAGFKYIIPMETNPIWKTLAQADPEQICRNSGAGYEPETDAFLISSFAETVTVLRSKRTIAIQSKLGERLLSIFREHYFLAVPAYLVYADGRECTRELIQPKSIPGGEIYRKGAHMLPLDRLARRFATDSDGFGKIGRSLGGEPLEYGDVSCRLFPFPYLPVSIVLWLKDDEFSERADLFFDSSSKGQFPPDILWGIATLCVELMLDEADGD